MGKVHRTALALQAVSALLPSPAASAFFSHAPCSAMGGRNGAATATHSLSSLLHAGGSDYDYTVAILGDLHIDPRKMDDYSTGRSHFRPILDEAKSRDGGCAVISLGDLGQPKNCEHNPASDTEIFAGTTRCHELAADFLGGFADGVPYDVVGGNHDLEGLDEFGTDEENLAAYLRAHGKDAPHFCREVAERTLLVGMGSTVFRDADFISHEVSIDRRQIDWFENLVRTHPAEEGWKIFVFTHAPPIGSGLRVLQENQIVDGCCWLNHNQEEMRTKFIGLVREHRCIKAWFSGHFHLGQDYHDSIIFPTADPNDGPSHNRGSCVFAQTSVMRSETSRDGRQQSRLLRGNKSGFEICTVDHRMGGKIRLDATIVFTGDGNVVCAYANKDVVYEHEKYFKIVKYHRPNVGDYGFKRYNANGIIEPFDIEMDTDAWWYMPCGRALGMFCGKLIEYDSFTLAPLGLVASSDELVDKKIGVISNSGLNADTCKMMCDAEEGAECSAIDDCFHGQAVFLLDKNGGHVSVIQPNEDGSYWRKFDRNSRELFGSRVVRASQLADGASLC